MRRILSAAIVALLLIAPAAAADGQAPNGQAGPTLLPDEPSASRITYDYSSAPLWRNAALGDAAWSAFALGVDWGLDGLMRDRLTRRSATGVAARAARLALLDLPMASYTLAWTHEYGHKTRVTEAGVGARVVVRGTPWTGLTAFTETTGPVVNRTPAMYSSGIEGTNVLFRRLERRLAQSGKAHYSELTAMFVATVTSFGYIQRDLAAGRVRQGGIFRTSDAGDPAGYVVTFDRLRHGEPTLDQLRDTADGVRRGSWLSLIDYSLVTVGVGLFRDYLVRGERQTPLRWITLGSVSLVPGLRYEMTPVGPERQVRSWIRIGPRTAVAYVRWTEGTDGETLIGAGGEYRSPIAIAGWQPAVAVDWWQNPGDTSGARFEASAEWPVSTRWSVAVAVGGKSQGYLIGFPLARGAYGSVGTALRF